MSGMIWEFESFTDALAAGGVLLAFFLVALLVRLLWRRLLGPLVHRTHSDLERAVLVHVRTLVTVGLLLLGLYYSTASLPIMQSKIQIVRVMGQAFGVAWVAFAVWTALRLFNGLVSWYVRRAVKQSGRFHDVSHRASLVRKAVDCLVLIIGLLYALRVAGVDITPLLASGAIGGLAVALALQDTLSNLFAGFLLNIDRPIKEGDFIKLSSGDEGFVEDIGWRNTKVRMWADNVVVIPNSKLSQSIITNYFLPGEDMRVYVSGTASYDNDLQRVEEVAIEVAREVLEQVEGADRDWEPVVRWKEFGDFAITFSVTLRVREFASQYRLKSEFVKALHRRFRDEGIEMQNPTSNGRRRQLAHAGVGTNLGHSGNGKGE